MGNHQFGLANRPPDFLGKGWSYMKEKRKTKERRVKSAPVLAAESTLRRPNSVTSFLKVHFTEMQYETEAVNFGGAGQPGASFSAPAFGIGNVATPKSIKRTSSVKRTRSMRCSPTVPDSVTLTLGMVNSVVLGASGVASGSASNMNPHAMANAMGALQKLTPAAPQLGKELSFDEFFEEAERRHQTMEVLQTAFIASPSAAFGAQNQISKSDRASSSNDIPSPTKDVIVLVENEPLERVSSRRPSPLQSTPPRQRSPVPSLTGLNYRKIDPFSQIIPASGTDDDEDALLSRVGKARDTHSSPTKNRVLIVVGGCEQEKAFDDDRWDRPPPTILVQPELVLYPPAISSSSSSSCLTTAGSPGPGSPQKPERRRGSYNPGASASSAACPLGVRFADQLVITRPEPQVAAVDKVQMREASAISRIKRRSSLRRKTIGGVTNSVSEDTSAQADTPSRTVDDIETSATPSTALGCQQRLSAKPLTKKFLSRADVAQSPPIISLLTQPQINLVRQLWQQLYATKGPTNLGNHIFQRAMFKNSHVRDVFRTVDIGNRCFNVDVMCKAHAKLVATVLDEVLKNIDNLELIESKLMDVGRQHAVFHDLGFQLNFWSVFAEAFIDCTLEWGEKNRRVEEARKAWAIIISYITDKMKLGYQEARRNLPRGNSGGRRIRVSETESATTAVLRVPIVRSDSH